MPSEARPWTRWWWMGSAVTREGISRELRELSAAGFGGVEITAIYGVRGAESAAVPYLTPEWDALVQHTVDEARRLGMRVDLPQGSGWRMGGPFVQASDVNASLRLIADSSSGRTTWRAEIRPSGDKVKRPAPGNEGFAIDVFSRRATDDYLRTFGNRLTLPRGALRSYFHDSFEYTGDGSPELFDFFQRRRGYDLRSELAALAGRADSDRVARVKSDYRQTLDEMLLENFVRPLTAWSHARGSLMREQAHGSPGNLLDLYAATDIPETEIFGPLDTTDANALINKFASSAAHVAGHRLASAESFTWLGEHWTGTLDDVKRAADGLFLSGINHLVYHGTAYSPANAPWPGWEFYASSEFNDRNAWWPDLPAFNAYVTRVQSVLQEGRADGDVLLYWPVWDAWHDAAGMRMDFRVHDTKWIFGRPMGDVARWMWKTGVQFDYVSDRQLVSDVSVRGGRVTTRGGQYATIVVPRTGHMPVETLEHLLALARAGATVGFVDALPADVPGLAQLDARRGRLAMLERGVPLIHVANGVRRASLGRGAVIVAPSVEALLAALHVRGEPLAAHAGVHVLRRARGDGYDYFIVNAGIDSIGGYQPIGVRANAALLTDPMTGRRGLAALRSDAAGTAAQLELAPGESRLLRTFDRSTIGQRWTYDVATDSAATLRGRWSVTFVRGGPVLPASFATDTLGAWTQRGDADADRFAGTARYALHFDRPTAAGGATDFIIDLGRVAESARVRINGKDVGVLIARPFRLHSGALRPRDNLLEIDVTNVSANRVRDLDRRGVAWKIYRDINYVNIDYKPFDASSWPVRPAGLFGPVTLTPVRTRSPAR